MTEFLATDFFELKNFITTMVIVTMVVFVRYIVFSGVAKYYLKGLFVGRELHSKTDTREQVKREIFWSFLTSLIFGCAGIVMIVLWQKGITSIYVEWSVYPIWYVPLSIIMILMLHETYYYWLHRWMHLPVVYRLMHKVHHDSLNTSAWTAFSFHPLESLLQALIIPLLVIFIPIHIYGLFFILTIMTVSATINHMGFEIYPKGWNRNPFLKWIIGATHHDQHHKLFRYNYGLYFTFWDRWMGTESMDFEKKFNEVVNEK